MAKQKELPPEVPPELPGAPADAAEATPPKHETPAPADAGGPVPRVIRGIERAPEGLTRFKIRALREEAPQLYLLAADEASARRHYLTLHGLDRGTPLSVRTMPD